MQLDFNEHKGLYVLKVDKGEYDIDVLMREHGLDYSTPASSPGQDVLFTEEDYAAVSFYQHATPRALARLAPLQASIDASWMNGHPGHFRVPYDKELWDFQKGSLAYALERQNTLIGDEPGLGKTQIGIAFCNEIKAKSVLVVCPAQIRLQWADRIMEWSTMREDLLDGRRPNIHPILKGSHGTDPAANWTIVSYDLARMPSIGGQLAKGHFDCIVLDEPHYLKEASSKRSRAIFGGGRASTFEALATRGERILGLTGTPLPNRPKEAFVLTKGLCHDAIDFMGEDKFGARFNPISYREVVKKDGTTVRLKDERVGRHFELQNRLRANFMTRHVKHGPRGVMHQLQMPIYNLIRVEETKAVKEALAAEALLDIDPENWEGADFQVMGHIAAVRREMGIAIAPQCADYAELCLESGEEKLVLFAWHIGVLDILEKKLQRWGVIRIDGSDSAVSKQRKVNDFLNTPKKQVIMGNILSMGTGVDGLQNVANHCILAEADWTPANNQQAFDRLDRGGQRQQVQADIFVAPNSIGEKVLASALRKLQTTHKALDAQI